MIRKLLRELYLLPRGEQRALAGVSLLLILSLVLRLGIRILPERAPAGVDEFEKEARAMMAFFERADSLEQLQEDSLSWVRTVHRDQGSRYITPRVSGRQQQVVDLNRSDSVDLLPLPGIGPVFAGRIVKYRNLLGGFAEVDQLAEVYGLPQETIDGVRDRLFIDTSAIRKIRLDSATFGELLRHPYLDYDEVRSLVQFMEFKGQVKSINELLENNILDSSTITRMIPYFEFNGFYLQ